MPDIARRRFVGKYRAKVVRRIFLSEALLDQLLAAANHSGLTVDALEFLVRGVDESAAAILLGNASNLPKYMKSRGIPYRDCILIAPSIDIL